MQMSTNEWLNKVKEALLLDGFTDTLFQTIKPGQVFGLIKKLDNVWEMHVRGFSNGTLEAEIEISRDYVEHFNDNYRRDATPELTAFLDAYHIPYHINGNLPQMQIVFDPPQQLTPWKNVVALAALAAFLIWLGNK
jgi:glycosidase